MLTECVFKTSNITLNCLFENKGEHYVLNIENNIFSGNDLDLLKNNSSNKLPSYLKISDNGFLCDFELNIKLSYDVYNSDKEIFIEIFFIVDKFNTILKKEVYFIDEDKVKLLDIDEYILNTLYQSNLNNNIIKCCSNCSNASYSPFSSSSYLMCFKKSKDKFISIGGYNGLREFSILKSLKYDIVNDFFYCNDFEYQSSN
ncbi:MAG: hypothetical protein ACK4IX_02385 [Candidatus Sericytochromatia bacterium]